VKTIEIINTKIPDPDSQFRLRPCSCSSENVGYLHIRTGGRKPWAVRCFTCGKTSDMFLVRHDAQVYWNTNMAVTPKKELCT
jgi:hypothetical protein